MVEVINRTPFQVAPLPGRFGFPAHSITFIVKATLALVHDGICVVTDEQLYAGGDVPYADDEEFRGAPRYEMDFAPFKPVADVLLVGDCHAPGGQPVTHCQAGLSIGSRSALVTVTGDRYWQVGLVRARATEPVPFTRMPLRFERAYGGPDDPRNPIGTGFRAERLSMTSDTALLLPNIEHPDRLIHAPGDDPGPAGLGPVGRGWRGRMRHHGTYDKHWEQHRWPWYPEDFDWHFWNASANALIPGYLQGDETLTLTHVHPVYPNYQTRLPDHRLRLFVHRKLAEAGVLEEVPVHLDTLWIDAQAEQAVLLWRGTCASADPEASDIEQVYVDSEQASAAERPLAWFQGRYLQSLAEIEAEWAMEAEAPTTEGETGTGDEAEVAHEATDEDEEHQALERAIADLESRVPPPPEAEAGAAITDPAEAEQLIARHAAEFEEPEPASVPDETAWTRERVEATERSGSLAGADLSGLDLTSLDLTGRDLSRAILSAANLSNTLLTGADLSEATLVNAVLTGTDFRGAWLADADLQGAAGAGADFSTARMARARLTATDLPDALFRRADLADADFTEASVIGGDFTAATLRSALFSGASLATARLDHVDADNADFQAAVLTRLSAVQASFVAADFSAASMPGADFSKSDLREALLEGVEAPGLILEDADLRNLRAAEGSNFSGLRAARARADGAMWEAANLDGADFTAADLAAADFSAASLRNARLDCVDAREARFIGSDLSGTDLSRSNLFNGSLERTRLAGANLRGANCYGVEFLDAEVAHADLAGANLAMSKLAREKRHG
ncbi:MAG: DUF2169 domain-containing protein [Aquisalimonadaceae bacterium]